MFSVFINAWKVKEIRRKLLYIIAILAIYRLGANISVPGINNEALANMDTSGGMMLYQIIIGAGQNVMSIFNMGIGPYITSSIIMQLLTVAIPKLERMRKEGEEGQKKINNITRFLTVALALLQAIGQTYSYSHLFVEPSWILYISSVLTMVCGTTLIMWLAEQITAKALGNGTSMIIFANILSNVPLAATALITTAAAAGIAEWVKLVILIVVFLFVIAFVVLAQQGERRLPVQYSKKMVGRRMVGGQSTFIPIKVNIAGVISIIFALSLIQFPQVIGSFLKLDGPIYTNIVTYTNIHHPVGAIIYIILIFLFTFFYTSIVFNPVEVAENMRKNGGFIPGIRPGQPTATYLAKVVNRVTFIGALFYALVALSPILIGAVFGMSNVGFGGTTLLIVVGVALEIVKQIESQLLMRHYQGFLKE